MAAPRIIDDPAFHALRSGRIQEFHRLIKGQATIDFSGGDLRGADLREADMSKVVLRNAYLRSADLRGLDLRKLDLEGCSLHAARISGVFFPENIAPEEIRLSHDFGTRLRVRS